MKTLNDFAVICPELAAGNAFKIWYFIRSLRTRCPDIESISADYVSENYVLLGSIGDQAGATVMDKLEEIFHTMQGENWSPEGEARSFIQASGSSHTSMSVDDIIETIDAYYIVMGTGFKEIKKF